MIVLLIVLGFSIFNGVLFYMDHENKETNPAAEGYFSYLKNKDISREVWTSNPVISFYTDASVNKIYYPVYNEEVSTDFYNYLNNNSDDIEYVLLDNCGGGIICPPEETACEEKNNQIKDFLEENFNKVYDAQFGRCFYLIYKN